MAEVPGVRPEDLELTIAGGVLGMKGRCVEPDGTSEERFRRQERPRGVWQQALKFHSFMKVKLSGFLMPGMAPLGACPYSQTASHPGPDPIGANLRA